MIPLPLKPARRYDGGMNATGPETFYEEINGGAPI
jgi:hypothetical protein